MLLNASAIAVRKENRRNFYRCFHSFLRIFENSGILRVFVKKISHIQGEELSIKAGQITESNSGCHQSNETFFDIITLIFE